MLTILIPEKIPAHNKGEEAIFRGICKTLASQGLEYKIYLYSESPNYDGSRYEGKAEIIRETLIPNSELTRMRKLNHLWKYGWKHIAYICCPPFFRRMLFKGKLWRVYDEIDMIILGHDNAFSFAHNFLILFGKVIGKKVVMYGASILPHLYEKNIPRVITKYCLNKLDLITLREPKSKEFLQRIGLPDISLHVTADKAFLLDPIERKSATDILKGNGVNLDKKPLIGMTVVYGSGVFRRGLINYSDPDEKYRVYVNTMARVVEFLVEDIGAEVVFMPHTVGPSEKDDDRKVAHDVRLEANVSANVIEIINDYSASELKGLIGCCDFFVGARTHSVIAALSMGVPSVVLSYPKDYRTYGIIGDMLEQRRWIYNIEYLEEQSLISLIEEAWTHRDEIRRCLQTVVPRVRDRAVLNGELLSRAIG